MSLLEDLIRNFASKKLLVVLLAYSLIVLDGTSALELNETVVTAAATALTAQLVVQGAIDYRAAKPSEPPPPPESP